MFQKKGFYISDSEIQSEMSHSYLLLNAVKIELF